MSLELQIVFALILDSVFGDPRWVPHPVRLIGWLALKTESLCRFLLAHEKTAGIASVAIVLSVVGFCGW